jgi:hypothetical protein
MFYRPALGGVLAAYIIHILDETLMNGGFVEKVKQHWWPDYRAIKYKEYSPGLLSGLLFFILAGFIIHYGPTAGIIRKEDFTIGLVAGCMGGLLLALLPMVIMPAARRRK